MKTAYREERGTGNSKKEGDCWTSLKLRAYNSYNCSFVERRKLSKKSGEFLNRNSSQWEIIPTTHKNNEWIIITGAGEREYLIQSEFNELAIKWKRETGVFSTTFDKINETYLDIIAMGKSVIPFMLKDMLEMNGSAHWHTALKVLTKENPVPKDEMNKTKKIKEYWIKWGMKNKLI